jgi:P27 family predicted phage terminase small subunit
MQTRNGKSVGLQAPTACRFRNGDADHMAYPRKTEKLHDLHGTKATPVVNATLSPHAAGRPSWRGLSGEAKRVFKELCTQLEERKALTQGDRSLLMVYARVWDRWRIATSHVEAEGSVIEQLIPTKDGKTITREKLSPWLIVAQNAEKQLVQILVQLGLTPAARDKVKMTAAPQEKPVDPLDAFQSRKPSIVPFRTQYTQREDSHGTLPSKQPE